jgi:hypothetical protein
MHIIMFTVARCYIFMFTYRLVCLKLFVTSLFCFGFGLVWTVLKAMSGTK